jgi:hypothetical protein
MQIEHKRACPSCGAANTLDASFCWKCYTSFAPGGSQLPAPPTTSRGTWSARRRIVTTVVGVVVVLLVGGVVRNLLRPDYHVPESLPGLQRIQTPQTEDFERRMKAEGTSNNTDLEVAVYGVSTEPQVFLVLANGKAVENTDELFRQFLSGAESTGAVVDREAETTGTYDGADWRCVPVRASGVEASVCIWREDASVGMTLDLEPDGDLSGALLNAYDASHA